ncbi:PTS sugar transporter subunit IIC [Erysipelothrix inopinata]|uniref:Permease IIC component n=1 Tax=Erysipelothrix inopinata TaxID=225084 RepID=A0A7G9RWI0_9FIRM|nr:PTS sugar transporter subunit IIC [Erysipelothrix inopinata]QNN59955.1 PTS sugar transporter subunit IIC [Erysipelothrix inopinata]
MEALTRFMDEKLAGPMTKLANQKHLRALRDGMVATLPIIIVGSFFLIIGGNLPLPADWGLQIFLKANAAAIVLPYRLSMGIMALYATFGIGHSLAESYDLDGLSGGIIATLAFLLTFTPVNVPADLQAGVAGWVLPMGNLGGGGMFVAIVTSMLGVEIFRFTDRSGLKIKMPEQVPTSVTRSFEAIFPTAIILIVFGAITYWLGFNWHTFISQLVSPLVSAADSYGSVMLQTFLNSFFWVFGIHGASIVGNIARPIWVVLLEQNQTLLAAGQPLQTIASEPFFQWFIYIGGSGATLGLAIAMVTVGKSSFSKQLGKTVFVPALFNINEPLMFGTPIVMNPILMIPFVVTPLILGTIAWFATSWGLVSKVSTIAPWTLPGPIGALMATGFDWRAAVLNIILIVIATLCYIPFFKIYDKSLLAEEQGN